MGISLRLLLCTRGTNHRIFSYTRKPQIASEWRLHDVGLMDGGDFLSAGEESEFKSVLSDSKRVGSSNDLNALHDSRVDLVLDTAVFSFSVFSQNDDVNAFVSGGCIWEVSGVCHVAEHVQVFIDPGVFDVD